MEMVQEEIGFTRASVGLSALLVPGLTSSVPAVASSLPIWASPSSSRHLETKFKISFQTTFSNDISEIIMLINTLRRSNLASPLRRAVRSISTLQSNPHIHVFPKSNGSSYILSFLSTNPPTEHLAIGTTTQLPPTTDSLVENPHFLHLLNEVLKRHAPSDPLVQSQAAAFASTSGSALGSGGMFFPQQQSKGRGVKGDGAGGASSQGGAGGAGRGGWVHVSDARAPPDYGRIAWPEDILGSLEVDGRGEFVKSEEGGGEGLRGNWQSSGSYRVITREGILGLSDYIRERLVDRLREEEKKGVL
ncbi:hypothetical protein HYALB_00002229 [Hymenoscyphus albidus]|uniref:Uncharacterized protein n=1 Tax=Hymenoscyphus albidus TaxID=595503 RepID=A0A9N9PSL8_9HELO|nr:hypothetical protein HYALB_00002229 [Hymenoscyphus albidus]